MAAERIGRGVFKAVNTFFGVAERASRPIDRLVDPAVDYLVDQITNPDAKLPQPLRAIDNIVDRAAEKIASSMGIKDS